MNSLFPDNVASMIGKFTGRGWIIKKISTWLSDDPSPVLLLTGEPGAGKSMVAAYIASHDQLPADFEVRDALLNIRHAVKGVHFCVSTRGSGSPLMLAENLCTQLASRIPKFVDYLTSNLGQRVHVTATQTIDKIEKGGKAVGVHIENLNFTGMSEELAFDLVVRMPLQKLYEEDYDETTLLIIDGVDEGLNYTGKITVDRLLAKLDDLPRKVKLLITTRPDQRILKYYNKYPRLDLVANDPEPSKDIKEYLAGQLSSIDRNSGEILLRKIVESSNGNFLFAHLVSEEVKKVDAAPDYVNQLSLPRGLKDYYQSFLNRELGSNERFWHEQYKNILGLLAVSYGDGFTFKLLKDISGQNIEHILRQCGQYIVGKLPEGPFSIFHKSFSDFLCVDSNNIDYHIEATDVHKRILNHFISRFENRWEFCETYALKYLGLHALACTDYNAFEQLMTDLSFLNARCSTGFLSETLQEYELFFNNPDSMSSDGTIRHCYEFLLQKSHLIRNSPQVFMQEVLNSENVDIKNLAISGGLKEKMLAEDWLEKYAGTNYQHHSGQIISMTFWGSRLVTSTTSLEVWIWDLGQTKLFCRCEQPPSPAKCLAVSPDKNLLAGCYGSDKPNPLFSGVIIWSKDGRKFQTYDLDGDWGYSLHWQSNTDLIVGSGEPLGSGARGRLWRINLDTQRLEQIGAYLSDRPFVLTWNHPNGRIGDIMALSMDGMVIEWTAESIAISESEAQEISLQLLTDGDYAKYDSAMAAKRPIVAWSCMPSIDINGFLTTAQMVSRSVLGILGESVVPPEFLPFHQPNADGVYFYDCLRQVSYGLQFREKQLPRTCMAGAPGTSQFAIGSSLGDTFIYTPKEGGVKIEVIERVNSQVTSLCFSDPGDLLAIGDENSQIEVYNTVSKVRIFNRLLRERPVAIHAIDSGILLLRRHEVEFIDFEGTPTRIIRLDPEVNSLDFDCFNDQIIVLGFKLERDKHLSQFVQHFKVNNDKDISIKKFPFELILNTANKEAENEMFLQVRCYARDKVLVLRNQNGLKSYSFLDLQKDRSLYLSPLETFREREITVLRMGLKKPHLSCENFSIIDSNYLFSAYSDNQDHPRISGQIRRWDLAAMTPSNPRHFGSAITALEGVTQDLVLVGTEAGEAELWTLKQDWEKLGGVNHFQPIVDLAFNLDWRFVCSASRDGQLMIWNFNHDVPIATTAIECEPVKVGFDLKRRTVFVVDKNGELHQWRINGLIH